MKPRKQHAEIMLYSDRVILMHMLKAADEGRVAMALVESSAPRLGATIPEIRSWISEYETAENLIPMIYHEEYYEQLDVDRWADKTAIFDADGNHVHADRFREGDILELAEMPFDKDGRHATGYAVWGKSAGGNWYWRDEYEEGED